MTFELWVVLAIGAALSQTTRNALAQSISSKISPALNSWARFTFCLPFAAIAALASISAEGLPGLPPSFFFFCLMTALTQLLGNVALVSAFRAGGFGESPCKGASEPGSGSVTDGRSAGFDRSGRE